MRKFDMRPRPLEITAQEILTKDRVLPARDGDDLLAHHDFSNARANRPRIRQCNLPARAIRHSRSHGDANA